MTKWIEELKWIKYSLPPQNSFKFPEVFNFLLCWVHYALYTAILSRSDKEMIYKLNNSKSFFLSKKNMLA